jgi:lysophosphatidylcholine acyltransferase/lyso-PAF acetyltransferase
LRAAKLINEIARDARWPQLAIYPEGNTSNGRQLCAFKLGAFQPGLPVQPLCIKYRGARCGATDPSWVEPLGLPLHVLVLRMLLSWGHSMEVTYLPVMAPTPEEVKEPRRFARRVQAAMAACLGVPVTEHSFGDTRLLFAARRLRLEPRGCLLEMDRAQREWGVSYSDCRDAMERFAAAGGAPRSQPHPSANRSSNRSSSRNIATRIDSRHQSQGRAQSRSTPCSCSTRSAWTRRSCGAARRSG